MPAFGLALLFVSTKTRWLQRIRVGRYAPGRALKSHREAESFRASWAASIINASAMAEKERGISRTLLQDACMLVEATKLHSDGSATVEHEMSQVA